MREAYRRGNVYIQDQRAGMIEETEDGYRFTYEENYLLKKNAVPVSLTLPLQNDPYTASVLFPFFDGLIPEGWLLSIVTKNWKISQEDRFGLLLAACRDCIGDVSIEAVVK